MKNKYRKPPVNKYANSREEQISSRGKNKVKDIQGKIANFTPHCGNQKTSLAFFTPYFRNIVVTSVSKKTNQVNNLIKSLNGEII